MRAIRALFRGWLNHPWRAFWLTVVAFYAGLFSLVLVAPPPAALTVGPVFVIGVVLILLASAVRGFQVSWRRSRRGAVINVGVPMLLLVLISGGGALMREHMVGRARHANASADARALGDAVTKYAAHMGRLPNALTELTAPATNAKGETAGPFIERLAPPVGMRGEGAPFDGMTPVSRSRNRGAPVLRRVPRCAARCNVVTLKLLRKWRARPTNPLP